MRTLASKQKWKQVIEMRAQNFNKEKKNDEKQITEQRKYHEKYSSWISLTVQEMLRDFITSKITKQLENKLNLTNDQLKMDFVQRWSNLILIKIDRKVDVCTYISLQHMKMI